jgi:hypothetical protein
MLYLDTKQNGCTKKVNSTYNLGRKEYIRKISFLLNLICMYDQTFLTWPKVLCDMDMDTHMHSDRGCDTNFTHVQPYFVSFKIFYIKWWFVVGSNT